MIGVTISYRDLHTTHTPPHALRKATIDNTCGHGIPNEVCWEDNRTEIFIRRGIKIKSRSCFRLLCVFTFWNPSIRILVDCIAQSAWYSCWILQLLGVGVGFRGARHEEYSPGLGAIKFAVPVAVVRLEYEECCERAIREAAGGDAAGSSDCSTSAPMTWCRATQCLAELPTHSCL